MLLAEFEVAIKEEKETVERLMDIFEMVYEQDLEALWLLNVVPLMLSLVKNSSDFHRALFQSRL